MHEDLIRHIEALAEPSLQEAGAELIRLTVKRLGSRMMIELITDKPRGGITMEECAVLNRRLVDALEAQNLITEEYVLEVSSPGLDWPLTTPKDFSRALYREIKIVLAEPVAEKWEYIGRVHEVQPDAIILASSPGSQVKKKQGLTEKTDVTIPLTKIVKAVQII